MEVGGRVETVQSTTLLRTATILRSVLETRGYLPHSNSSERPSANADVKNSQGVNITINNFGIQEADMTKQEDMKEKIKRESYEDKENI